MNKQEYYRGEQSLYYWASVLYMDAYQFDMCKRLLRKKRWHVKEDIKKTIDLIEIILTESDDNEEVHYNVNLLEEFFIDWNISDTEKYLIKLILNRDYVKLLNVLKKADAIDINYTVYLYLCIEINQILLLLLYHILKMPLRLLMVIIIRLRVMFLLAMT